MTDAALTDGSELARKKRSRTRSQAVKAPRHAQRIAGGGLCPEAELISSELELDLALEDGAQIPQAILDAFESPRRQDQVAGAIELRRWKAVRETQPRLGMSYEVIRDALARAAGAPPTTAHTLGNPPATDDDYRAAISSMLDELRRIYTLVLGRDWLFGRIRLVGLWLLFALFGVLVLTRWLDGPLASGVANLVEIAAAGAQGSIVSILRRMQDANGSRPMGADPVQQISALREGYPSLAIAVVTGPIFAITLFVVFASHLVSIQGLTPMIEACGGADKPCLAGHFTVMNHTIQFGSAIDGLKMLLWGFVAGFAEKLVPDVLDKITGSLPTGSKGH